MMLGILTQNPIQQLQKININQLVNLITTPPMDIQHLHFQLQSALSLDRSKYTKIICWLPYMVIGVFNPPVAETANFGYSNWLAISINNLLDQNLKVKEIKKQLSIDPHIYMIFSNPDRNGITILFRLKNPCYDPNQYAIIWSSFMHQFFKAHNIEKVLNLSQADICNRFYLGWDKKPYINPQADKINNENYFNEDSHLTYKQLQQIASKTKIAEPINPPKNLLTKEQLVLIKSKLGIKTKTKPDGLQKRMHEFVEELTQKFRINGLTVVETQYQASTIKIFFREETMGSAETHKMNIFFDTNRIYFTHSIGQKPNETVIVIMRQLIQKYI